MLPPVGMYELQNGVLAMRKFLNATPPCNLSGSCWDDPTGEIWWSNFADPLYLKRICIEAAPKENSTLQRVYNAMGLCPKQKPINFCCKGKFKPPEGIQCNGILSQAKTNQYLVSNKIPFGLTSRFLSAIGRFNRQNKYRVCISRSHCNMWIKTSSMGCFVSHFSHCYNVWVLQIRENYLGCTCSLMSYTIIKHWMWCPWLKLCAVQGKEF